jgi:hypothetical protein
MFPKTPETMKRKIDTTSPVSVTEVRDSGEVVLTDEGLQYVENNFVSEYDPFFVIHWTANGIDDVLLHYHGGALADLPNPPGFLQLDSPE